MARVVALPLATLMVAAWLVSWDLALPAHADESGRMVMVLDSSGSMKEQANGGETKIAAAKKALGDVVDSLPEDQSVGLRVYGAEVFSADDPGACEDSQLVVPVETGNRDQLRQAISSYRPYGETPIGYALQEAGKDLGNEGKRNIVLVSDGEPTCAPDPCVVARGLAKDGIDLRIDVVGLDVDGKAKSVLQCVARAGGGVYYDASSSEELSSSLTKLATRAARPFTGIGQPVTGTPTTDGAPEIGAGDWLDEIGEQQEDVRTYEVTRETPGSTLHVSASVRNSSSYGEEIRIELTTEDGATCGEAVDFTQLSAGQLISAGTSADDIDLAGGVVEDDPCATADSVFATVTDKTLRDDNEPKQLEVRVYEEPPVEDAASLPEPSEDGTWAAPPRGKATKVVGGSSFEDAPVLEPGVYRDTIVPGEVLTYQVEAGWGQQVSALAKFAPMSGKLADAVGKVDVLSRVTLFSPTRRVAAAPNTVDGPPMQAFLDTNGHEVGATTSPITYRNRGMSNQFGGANIDGSYTVTVYLEEDPDGDDYLVPFTLSVGASGTVAGEPTYAEEPEPVESPTPSSSGTASGPTSSGGSTSSSSGDDGGIDPAALALGGAGVAALAAAGVVVARSRRSATE
ncbi:vWA domain-containing protein [Nocardioides caldifontis]|uniref:vWA domain-containing protein n=1 Tax=Nocardioides caldifontis TaxID=2588938 RepID=UPI00139679B6|nr:VWA domain-containing protein [Nocardioides caldifontis]